eukprot:TRINITY_DN4071_c0_g2_i2.p1 TRINITY_DN4071_c0_g2~~TRINITY_DN4071_c0_g2_i2.p1  ORF type:complete len:126 (-),score=22.20 TRINITY_DN4071_c0_g2_i2:306-683(-)
MLQADHNDTRAQALLSELGTHKPRCRFSQFFAISPDIFHTSSFDLYPSSCMNDMRYFKAVFVDRSRELQVLIEVCQSYPQDLPRFIFLLKNQEQSMAESLVRKHGQLECSCKQGESFLSRSRSAL